VRLGVVEEDELDDHLLEKLLVPEEYCVADEDQPLLELDDHLNVVDEDLLLVDLHVDVA